VQAPAHAPAGALVGIAQFTRDVRGPPLAVGHMAVDVDKINNSVTKGKAVVVLHTWKDHLWALGSKGEPPDALPLGDGVTGGPEDENNNGDGADGNVGNADAPRPSVSQEPASENTPAASPGGAEEIEKLTSEGTILRLSVLVIPYDVLRLLRSVHASAHGAAASSPDDPSHTSKFCVPDADDHPVHGTYPPRSILLAYSYDPRRY
jgi:hypothetical protein